jgi:cytochrome c oxidase assembly factor CtaG
MSSVETAALGSWSLPWGLTLTLVVAGMLYLRGWFRLNRIAPQRFSVWRAVSFFAGISTLFVAVASPLDAFANLMLSVHMVQHLLLTMVVPPLLLQGFPLLPLLMGLPGRVRSEGLAPFLVWKPLKGFGRALIFPPIALVLFIGSNILWHVPPLYELALRNPAWHQVEHFCFLVTSILFWWPVVAPWPAHIPWPRWSMVPYLLLADLQNTGLAAFLCFYDRVLYPTYAQSPGLWGINPLKDQAGAGAIMWVPGSIAFLVPAGVIIARFLSGHPRHIAPHKTPRPVRIRPAPRAGRPDLLRVPIVGRLLRSRLARRVLQCSMFGLAILIVLDGWFGPQMSAMNLAGVLPWTHWRGFTVLALLVAGNFFCLACPFTFVRDLGRKVLPAKWEWPRPLRSKWLSIAMIGMYLWAYEAFDLWDSPWLTAWIIVGYFGAALVIDGLYRGAAFCKYVCPIGQFHFVQSMVAPLEVAVREPTVCASCKSFDCIRGNAERRGCELELFQPRKVGNLDCTFCLDCVHACPHDNVGVLTRAPGQELWTDRVRSSIGRLSERIDWTMLVALLTFGAFVNAAGMISPVKHRLSQIQEALDVSTDFLSVTLFVLVGLIAIPALTLFLAGSVSNALGSAKSSWRANAGKFVFGLVPLGAAMWVAHFGFHLFTGSHTPVPVFERVWHDLGLSATVPDWSIRSWAFPWLLDGELLLLDAGLLLSLYACWRLSRQFVRKHFLISLPWLVTSVALYLVGVWIVFQPMEMRGTMQ